MCGSFEENLRKSRESVGNCEENFKKIVKMEWTFSESTFYQNGRIPKDISRKLITERTFTA